MLFFSGFSHSIILYTHLIIFISFWVAVRLAARSRARFECATSSLLRIHSQIHFMLLLRLPNAGIKSNLVIRLSCYSTGNRLPYAFTLGASFAGKPSSRKIMRSQASRFPPQSDIAKWTREQLKARKSVLASSPGEDAFFVHEAKSRSVACLCTSSKEPC